MTFEKIKYVDRVRGETLTERVPGETFLKFLYYTPFGKIALESMVKRKFLSVFYGWLMCRRFSRKKIKKFVMENGIDMEEAKKEIDEFATFNDFFYRELKEGARQVAGAENVLASPADGKVLAYESICCKSQFIVKGFNFTLEEFLGDKSLARRYQGGTMFIVRLAPADYHRFHFPASGIAGESKSIRGYYYSVSPHALKKNSRVFCENKREYSLLETKTFGKLLICEVGAAMVGSIRQTYKTGLEVKKGQEKGYFLFGGSTLVLLFERGKIEVDGDILENTLKGIETRVKMGESLGTAAD